MVTYLSPMSDISSLTSFYESNFDFAFSEVQGILVVFLKNNLKQSRPLKVMSQFCQHIHLSLFFLHKKARSYKFQDTVPTRPKTK